MFTTASMHRTPQILECANPITVHCMAVAIPASAQCTQGLGEVPQHPRISLTLLCWLRNSHQRHVSLQSQAISAAQNANLLAQQEIGAAPSRDRRRFQKGGQAAAAAAYQGRTPHPGILPTIAAPKQSSLYPRSKKTPNDRFCSQRPSLFLLLATFGH